VAAVFWQVSLRRTRIWIGRAGAVHNYTDDYFEHGDALAAASLEEVTRITRRSAVLEGGFKFNPVIALPGSYGTPQCYRGRA
jgi:hypothetical protein